MPDEEAIVPPPDVPSVLIEFSERPGMRRVALTAPDAIHRSAEALQHAMDVIHSVTDDLQHSVQRLTQRPDRMEVEFGVKFDTEVGAIIAKAGVEAAIKVRLAWERKGDSE